MTTEYDPIDEPLRLLRETSLAAGFEDRLAERLAQVQRQGVAPVRRLHGRKRLVFLIAAIALPAAAAAAAGSYYVQQRTTKNQPSDPAKHLEGKPLGHLPRAGFKGAPITVPAVPAPPSIETLSAPRLPERTRAAAASPKSEARTASGDARQERPLQASEALRIEALDPFASKATMSRQTNPRGTNASESLRKAAEQGSTRVERDRVRNTQRDVTAREVRGSDAAQQVRDRVQARERKGQ